MDVIIRFNEQDDGKITAKFLTDFILYYIYEILYFYRDNVINIEDFETTSFYGIFVHKCIKTEIFEFFDNSKPVLNNLIRHNKLRNILVKISSYKNEQKFELVLLLSFFQQQILLEKKIYEFKKNFAELKQNFCEALLDLQTTIFKSNSNQNFDVIKLNIVSDLILSTNEQETSMENTIKKSNFY